MASWLRNLFLLNLGKEYGMAVYLEQYACNGPECIQEIMVLRTPLLGTRTASFWTCTHQRWVIPRLCFFFNWARHEGVLGEWGISPLILDLGTRWRWVVSFTPRPLYPQGKSPCYPLDRRLGGPQSRSGRRESNPRTPIIQAVAQRYTDWAIPALSRLRKRTIGFLTSVVSSSWRYLGEACKWTPYKVFHIRPTNTSFYSWTLFWI
jgi:hypothetical protein